MGMTNRGIGRLSPDRIHPKKGPGLHPLASGLLVTAVAIVFVYPFAWMFFAAFKSNTEIFRPLDLFPESFDVTYYHQLLNGDWFPFGRVFANSVLIALLQSVGAVGMSAMAGYVFGRHKFRFQVALFALALVVIVVPRQALAIPLFAWMNTLHLSDNPLGVILPGMVSGLGVIFFTQVFRQLPAEYVETARLAGASEWRVFLTLLPLVRPALISFALVEFILAWHQHLIPLLILSSPTKLTLPLALSSLYGSSLRFPYAVLMAGSTLTLLPTVILFGLLYKRFKSALGDLLIQ